MENRREMVCKHLYKHFPEVYVEEWDNNVSAVCCRLSKNLLEDDEWLYFPFDDDEFIKHNSYDIVNAIWEYIIKYIL